MGDWDYRVRSYISDRSAISETHHRGAPSAVMEVRAARSLGRRVEILDLNTQRFIEPADLPGWSPEKCSRVETKALLDFLVAEGCLMECSTELGGNAWMLVYQEGE
jgi:hypothetical protein